MQFYFYSFFSFLSFVNRVEKYCFVFMVGPPSVLTLFCGGKSFAMQGRKKKKSLSLGGHGFTA